MVRPDDVGAVPGDAEVGPRRVLPLAAAAGQRLPDAAGPADFRRLDVARGVAGAEVLDADLAVVDPVGPAVGLEPEVALRELARRGRRVAVARVISALR